MDLVALLDEPDPVAALIAGLQRLSDASKMAWALEARLPRTPGPLPKSDDVQQAEQVFDHIAKDGSADEGWMDYFFDRDYGHAGAWLHATRLVGDAAQALEGGDRPAIDRLAEAFTSLE